MTQQRYVVTGIASGIGAATAALLRNQGHWVIGLDIQHESDNADDFIQVDLADPSSIEEAVLGITGQLDGLCNIAGLPPRKGLERKILQVNYFGTRQLTAALLQRLDTGSSIVNLASRAGHGWMNNIEQVKRLNAVNSAEQLNAFLSQENIDSTRAYNLSKEAVILWAKAETEDMIKQGIRINSISPGAVDTPILDDFAQAYGEPMKRNVERAGRPGRADEIAPVVAFLLSPASSWINGTDIPVDGGMGAFVTADKIDLSALRHG